MLVFLTAATGAGLVSSCLHTQQFPFFPIRNTCRPPLCNNNPGKALVPLNVSSHPLLELHYPGEIVLISLVDLTGPFKRRGSFGEHQGERPAASLSDARVIAAIAVDDFMQMPA